MKKVYNKLEALSFFQKSEKKSFFTPLLEAKYFNGDVASILDTISNSTITILAQKEKIEEESVEDILKTLSSEDFVDKLTEEEILKIITINELQEILINDEVLKKINWTDLKIILTSQAVKIRFSPDELKKINNVLIKKWRAKHKFFHLDLGDFWPIEYLNKKVVN